MTALFKPATVKPGTGDAAQLLPKHIVGSGGVVWGIIIIGVMEAIQEYGLNRFMQSIAASSIASLIGLALAVNLSIKDFKVLLLEKVIDLYNFLDPVDGSPFAYQDTSIPLLAHMKAMSKPITYLLSSLWHLGFCHGNYIEDVVTLILKCKLANNKSLIDKVNIALNDAKSRENLLSDKQSYNAKATDESIVKSLKEIKDFMEKDEVNELTLEHLHQLKLISPEDHFLDLFVTATQMTWSGLKNIIMDYKSNPPVSVKAAIRASMSIPGIYKFAKVNNTTLFDGGISDNTPIKVYKDNPKTKDDIVLGITFGRRVRVPNLTDDEKSQFILLPPIGSRFNFLQQKENIEAMIQCGYTLAVKHFKTKGYDKLATAAMAMDKKNEPVKSSPA